MSTQTASPRTRQSSPKVAKLHRHDNGAIHALSSNGRSVYVVRIGEQVSCTCPGFTHCGRCYHVANAVQRFAAFWPRPVAVIVPADHDPEPPTPAAPAVRRLTHSCTLYGPDGCRA